MKSSSNYYELEIDMINRQCNIYMVYIVYASYAYTRLVPEHTHGDLVYSAAPMEKYDLVSYWIILSWHWANQSLPYHNAEGKARKREASIL